MATSVGRFDEAMSRRNTLRLALATLFLGGPSGCKDLRNFRRQSEGLREFSRQEEQMRNAMLGKTPEKIVTGTLRATTATIGEKRALVVVTGKTQRTCQPAPAGCHNIDEIHQFLQLPMALEGPSGRTAIQATVSAIWWARDGYMSRAKLPANLRVDTEKELEKNRLWTFVEGETMSAYGLVDNVGDGPTFRSDVELIVGDPNIFVRGI